MAVSSDALKSAGLIFSLSFAAVLAGVLFEAWKSRRSAAAVKA